MLKSVKLNKYFIFIFQLEFSFKRYFTLIQVTPSDVVVASVVGLTVVAFGVVVLIVGAKVVDPMLSLPLRHVTVIVLSSTQTPNPEQLVSIILHDIYSFRLRVCVVIIHLQIFLF